MSRSLCFLVLCTNEAPDEVMKALKMCVWLRNEHPTLGDGVSRTAKVMFCHMEIEKDSSGNVSLGRWADCVNFCRSNGVGVIPLSREDLLSPYLTSALTLAMLDIENSFETLLLLDGNAHRSPLGDTSPSAIWRAVDALYGEPDVWVLISKSRQFALMRSDFFRKWYPLYFASEGRTCRRAGLLSPLFHSGKVWPLDPLPSVNHAYEHLAAVFRGMDEVGVLDGYLSWKFSMYRIETKPPEQYALVDFLWMLELCARLRSAPLMILPITARTWATESIKAGALIGAPESVGSPTMSGVRFLGTMLALPFAGAAIGTLLGSQLGNWKLGGFYGLMCGLTMSVLGQLFFFRRNR